MKASNLQGEYCQSCASTLDDVQRNHRKIIVLDSQCMQVFQQSGDLSRLDGVMADAQMKLQAGEPPKLQTEVQPEPPAKYKQEVPQEAPAKPAKKKTTKRR